MSPLRFFFYPRTRADLSSSQQNVGSSSVCEFSGYVPEKIRFLTHQAKTWSDLRQFSWALFAGFLLRSSQLGTGSNPEKKMLIVGFWIAVVVYAGGWEFFTRGAKKLESLFVPGEKETTNPAQGFEFQKGPFFSSFKSEEDLLVEIAFRLPRRSLREYNSKWKREKRLAGPGKARFILCFLLFLFWDLAFEDVEAATCAGDDLCFGKTRVFFCWKYPWEARIRDGTFGGTKKWWGKMSCWFCCKVAMIRGSLTK